MALDYLHIRDMEVLNTSRVDFYRDGGRFYAFQRSAWFVAAWLSPGHGFDRMTVNHERLVYITLSEEELDALLLPFKNVIHTDEKVMVPSGIPFNISAYNNWKDWESVERSAAMRAGNRKPSLPVAHQQRLYEQLWNQVKTFDEESADDLACRIFIADLKKLIHAEQKP